MLKLYNTLSKKLDEILPYKNGSIGLYACGPTVYDYSHIGHGRKYVNDDVLKRVLEVIEKLKVTHVQNITDVGHLVSDADSGEDKIEKGAKKYGMTVWEVAQMYTEYFLQMADKLNIIRPDIQCKATDHIKDQIDMIQTIIKNGYAYVTDEVVYFDTAKFPGYGELFGQKISDKFVGVREEVETDNNKKNPADFVLWFKRVGKHSEHVMHWPSPWGDGFPGWHIECSAMSMKYLGDQFEIHTGGEDHVSVHHPNEIAQSEAFSGKKPFVKYWFHSSFLMVDGQKMSKSLGNMYKIEDIEERGFSPLALRYYYLTTHYRKTMNFTWDGLESSAVAWRKLNGMVTSLPESTGSDDRSEEGGKYTNEFISALEEDLNTPKALAVVWETLKSNLSNEEKKSLITFFDKVLGLDLGTGLKTVSITPEISQLLQQREQLRKEKRYAEADDIRSKLEKLGYKVSDK